MATSTLLRLVEAGDMELTANLSDLLPPEVAGITGAECREVRTRGDGACAAHAAFGALGSAESLQLEAPRRFSRGILSHPLQVTRSRVRPTEQHLIVTVLSSLWEFALTTDAVRNEEAIFLDHLRASPHWGRVVEALGNHRERQADFDADDAIAQQLSGGIFRRSLDARLWQRLTITAGVGEK